LPLPHPNADADADGDASWLIAIACWRCLLAYTGVPGGVKRKSKQQSTMLIT